MTFFQEKDDNKKETSWYPARKEETKSEEKASFIKEVFENYIEPLKPVMSYCDDIFVQPRVEWIKKFIDKGGFGFLMNLLISEDSFLNKKIKSMDTMTQEEKQCFNAVVSLVGTFVLMSNLSNTRKSDEEIPPTQDAGDNLGTVDEDKEMEEQDMYEIDEEKLLKNAKENNPIRERTESSIAREKEIKKQNCIREKVFLSSQYEYNDAWNACTGEFGLKILNEIPYKVFFNQNLSILAHLLIKKDLNEKDTSTINIIISTLPTLCLMNEDLLEYFYNFYDEGIDMNIKQLIIKGLTFLHSSEIKDIFNNMIKLMIQGIKRTEKARLPLIFFLDI